MTDKYIYRGEECRIKDASGVSGVLIKTINGEYVFRVYDSEGEFIDYNICHDDLSVTIDANSLASFYTKGDNNILDHSPQVFNLKEVE